MSINWALAGRVAVIVIVLGVIYSVLILYVAEWLARRIEREQTRERVRRLARLADEADRIEEAWYAKEHEGDREFEGAFSLDENEQPHKPAA